MKKEKCTNDEREIDVSYKYAFFIRLYIAKEADKVVLIKK